MSPSQVATSSLVGREAELRQVRACLKAGRNVLLEGPVGVGKTQLALSVTAQLGLQTFRVDGDSRYTEQKLAGWFDPQAVLQKGYSSESFMAGPLAEAMRSGGVLFINEMNRLPEGVQNILLPAIDERLLSIPRLGTIQAAKGFLVLATQNPKEFVATTQLSEALLDRFELVRLDYQTEDEEKAIVLQALSRRSGAPVSVLPEILNTVVSGVRATRNDPKIRRGASVRAAIAWAEVAKVFIDDGASLSDALQWAAKITLPTRIEWERGTGDPIQRETEFLERVAADLKKKI